MDAQTLTRSLRANRFSSVQERCVAVKITLNGDPFEVAGPLTISALLAQLDIDSRRVAIEHNLVVLKRGAYDHTAIAEGDRIEIVNFVGGGGQRTGDHGVE